MMQGPLALLGGLLLCLGTFAAPALAQHGSMSMSLMGSESFKPDLSQRDLKVIIRVLGLQGDSLKSLQDLYDGYAGTLASEGAAVREFVAETIERAETMQNVELLLPAQTRITEWEKRSEQIKKTFLEDLKSLLTRDEEARWPIAERELRRLRYISGGMLSGENVDLVRLTENVVGESGATGELADLLNRYSDELDHALIARKRALDEHKDEYTKAVKSDAAKARACWAAINDARLKVQGVNDRYARLLAAQVPADKKQAFERKWFEQCYPAVCRPTRVDEYLKEARDLQSLSAEQITQLKAIASKYEDRIWQQRQGMAMAWRKFEEEHRKKALEDAISGTKEERNQQYNGAWLPESHPIVATRKDRLELDKDFRRQIDGVLTPEQREGVSSRLTPYAKFEHWEPYGV